MISQEDIKKLAGLARIRIDENEVENLRGEMEVILDYVGQIKAVSDNLEDNIEIESLRNVMRNDENPTESETYSKELIAEFPSSKDNYLKVKKIL